MREAAAIPLGFRAALALGMMVAFYLVAIALVVALFVVPIALIYAPRQLHFLQLKLLAACWAAAGVIAWSILPRFEAVRDPGPKLVESEHPRLFDLLRGVAVEAGEPLPPAVFLVPDVNAFVAQQGGFLGFGGRRLMGLGLPLLAALTPDELRSVVAHEFGHFSGGDTKLGPVLYRTRSAIVRSVRNLAEAGSFMQYPFLLFAKAFLRVSNSVSRSQELAADRLSARISDPAVAASALRVVHGTAPAFAAFWQQEVAPILNNGHLPGVSEGYLRLLSEPAVRAQLDLLVERASEQALNPYDTHPPLSERLAALGWSSSANVDRPAERAIELVDDPRRLERELLVATFGESEIGKLKPLGWDEVGDLVSAPAWRASAVELGYTLPGLDRDTILAEIRKVDQIGARLAERRPAETLNADQRRGLALYAISIAIAIALLDRGYRVLNLPGRIIELWKDDVRFDPFGLVQRALVGQSGEELERLATALAASA